MKKRKAYHHGDLKAHLAEAALAALAKGGPEALSLRDLCRVVGVSTMAPYRHFEDKAALLIYLAETGCRELLEMMTEVERNETDPLRCMARCAEVYTSFARTKPSQFRLIFGVEMVHLGERALPVIQVAGECIAILVRAITRAQASGKVRRDVPAQKIADVIWMAVHGYADLQLAGHQETSRDALSLLVETTLRGIAPTRAEKG